MNAQTLVDFFHCTPVALAQRAAPVVISSVADCLADAHFDSPAATVGGRLLAWNKGYDLVEGIARIPIEGLIVQRLGALRPAFGMTGLDGVRQAFLTALTDPAVEAIVLDINSPGGALAGVLDLADTIYGARGDKPIWAVLDESALAGAYVIASAADRATIPRTGEAGSCGLIALHVDMSRALNTAGIAITFLTYGQAKTDARPEIPLGKEARARLQAQLDQAGEMVLATVARNRGLSRRELRAQEGAIFQGQEARRSGLVDDVRAPDQALAELLAGLEGYGQ